MQLTSRFARLVKQESWAEVWLAGGWLAGLAMLEIAGRRFTSDLMDGAVLFAVCFFACMTGIVHKKRRLFLVTRVGKAWRFLWTSCRLPSVDIGVDLSKSPQLPRGIPASWKLSAVLLMLFVGGLVCVAPLFPSEARTYLSARCYLLWLAIEGLVWLGLSFGIVVYPILVWARLHDWLVQRHRGPQPRSIRLEVRATLVVFGFLLGCGMFCPGWLPFALHAPFLVVTTAASVAASPGLELIWRYRSEEHSRVFDGRWSYGMIMAGSILLAMAAMVIAGGEFLGKAPHSPDASTAPVTIFLGRVFAWAAVGGNFVVTCYAVRFAAMGILFHRDGFRPFGKQPSTPEDRRSEIQCRREIVRRLQMLFRRVKRPLDARGGGLWIAFQYWFALGLSLDSSHNETFDRQTTVLDDIIGPPYHRVFTGQSRRYFQRVTDALQVHLIYVERGVSFRRLVRVLRMMFEIYDIYGGRQRAEEMHFAGLPGVRVLIHDFDQSLSPRLDRGHYPEPDYEDVGRARILHVFKDRGEEFVETPIPASWEGTPVGSGV